MVRSGLLNKREYAAKDKKIQMLVWKQNLLQRLIQIFELTLKQASSVQVTSRRALRVVGLNKNNIDATLSFIHKSRAEQMDNAEMQKVNKYYLIRRLFLLSYFFIPIISFMAYINNYTMLVLLITLAVLAYIGSFLAYKKMRYGMTDALLIIDGGVFGRSRSVVEIYKTQAIKTKQTPFQRRRGLVTLEILNASGQTAIPEIEKEKATKIKNRILYLVESVRKDWM